MAKNPMEMTQDELLKAIMPFWGEGLGLADAHMWSKEEDEDWKSLCGETSQVVQMGIRMSGGGLCEKCIDLNPREED